MSRSQLLRHANRLGWILIFTLISLWGNPSWGREWQNEREQMVRIQLEDRGIEDRSVLQSMRDVPRHFLFRTISNLLPTRTVHYPSELGQTISQPYVVGFDDGVCSSYVLE